MSLAGSKTGRIRDKMFQFFSLDDAFRSVLCSVISYSLCSGGQYHHWSDNLEEIKCYICIFEIN